MIVWIVFIRGVWETTRKLSGAGSHYYGIGYAEGISILLRRGLGTPVT